MANKPKKLSTYILLDRSGSISGRWGDVIGGLNTYAKGLKAGSEKSTVTLMAFDSPSTKPDIVTMRDHVSVAGWQDIDPAVITPRGTTPLFDAIGRLHMVIKAADPKRAAIMILTDGMENASREFSKAICLSIVDEWKDRGYQVDFVGCDFDATGQAASVGVSADMSVTMTDYAAGMDMMATRSTLYASTGTVTGFSDAERKRAAK